MGSGFELKAAATARLDSQVRGEPAVLARKQGDFAAWVLQGEIETDTVPEFLIRKPRR